MKPRMRSGILALIGVAACGTNSPSPDEPRTFEFGPFDIQPSQEIANQCVQITLHNDTALFINQVELTTGPGFHHSNWFFVPADDPAKGIIGAFPGPDGVFTCADRSFDQAVAAFRGGVLFAQSTQSAHDIQAFPAGAALKIPAGSKLVTTIHLLNATDKPLHLAPTITLTPIAESAVVTHLSGVSFEDHALGLPPNSKSRFQLDCDLMPAWQSLYDLGNVSSPTPDFKLYYALAHYHAMGTGMTIEGLRSDDTTASPIFTTANRVGDGLGSTLDPQFDMTGFTRIRFACDFYNDTSATVGWGINSNEMCVFLAFSDSPYFWAGGALDENAQAGTPTDVDGVPTYTHPCQVYSVDATR
jgi:hypothetical protein